MVSQCCLWNSSLIFSFHCLVGDNPFHFLGPFDGQTSQRIKHNHHPKQILRQAPHIQFPRLTYPKTPQVSPFACCGAMVIFAQYLQEAERNLRNNHFHLKICHGLLFFLHKNLWETKRKRPKKSVQQVSKKKQHQAQLAVSQN